MQQKSFQFKYCTVKLPIQVPNWKASKHVTHINVKIPQNVTKLNLQFNATMPKTSSNLNCISTLQCLKRIQKDIFLKYYQELQFKFTTFVGVLTFVSMQFAAEICGEMPSVREWTGSDGRMTTGHHTHECHQTASL